MGCSGGAPRARTTPTSLPREHPARESLTRIAQRLRETIERSRVVDAFLIKPAREATVANATDAPSILPNGQRTATIVARLARLAVASNDPPYSRAHGPCGTKRCSTAQERVRPCDAKESRPVVGSGWCLAGEAYRIDSRSSPVPSSSARL